MSVQNNSITPQEKEHTTKVIDEYFDEKNCKLP